MSLGVRPDPATSFHMGSARLRLSGDPVRMETPIRRPRKRNMLRCASEVREGFRIRQSLRTEVVRAADYSVEWA